MDYSWEVTQCISPADIFPDYQEVMARMLPNQRLFHPYVVLSDPQSDGVLANTRPTTIPNRRPFAAHILGQPLPHTASPFIPPSPSDSPSAADRLNASTSLSLTRSTSTVASNSSRKTKVGRPRPTAPSAGARRHGNHEDLLSEPLDFVQWVSRLFQRGKGISKLPCLLCGKPQKGSMKRHVESVHRIIWAKSRLPHRFDRLEPAAQAFLLVNCALLLREENPTPDESLEVSKLLNQKWIFPRPLGSQMDPEPITGLGRNNYPLIFRAFWTKYGKAWRYACKCPNCQARLTRGESQRRHLEGCSGGIQPDYDTDDYATDSEEFRSGERGVRRKKQCSE
ncbi:uncharacterized protein EI90DRAFT_3119265 [Cantharellus anzutake]|uniref:uncharacterized protein n=1 Tax=Cantharellus anzutake TaxID=1750568 RepID=UPI0019034FA0|nr:uncharacterized protein EI90DRAFT_3119265 [Cantharellus anzutake]KAF8336958.1 hypothetical protein EI90DRAFT_3119265 [Cantharellus anzutake]